MAKYYPVEKIDLLAKEILNLMPPLEEFFSGDDSILSYSKKLNDYQVDSFYIERQKPFLKLINAKISRLFNDEEKSRINVLREADQGLRGAVVDHHGILNDPILFGLNIVTDYFKIFDRKNQGDIFTFATGNVPLGDPFHRRGFEVDGQHVNLFPKDEKNKFVFRLPNHEFNIVDNLKKNHTWHLYSPAGQEVLIKAENIIKGIDFSTCEMLGDQLTKINFHLWPLLFEDSIRTDVPNLVSLEYDDIVSDYLCHVLQNDSDNFVSNILFDSVMRDRALLHFEGKTGAWDKVKNKGTHFFWLIDEKNEQVRLSLKGNTLVSEDGKFSLEFTKDDILKKLKERWIIPGMLLKFSLLIFYMGLRPLTGYGSANYITVMQEDLMGFLGEAYPEEVSRMGKIKVNSLTTVPVVHSYAFDIIKDSGLTKEYLINIDKVPLKYFMAPRLNDIYDYAFSLYGQGQKINIQIQPEDYEHLLKGIV